MFFSSILTNTASGLFHWVIYNSKSPSARYLGDHNDVLSRSGMVAVELAVGDTVFLVTLFNQEVHRLPCYTLIKIK